MDFCEINLFDLEIQGQISTYKRYLRLIMFHNSAIGNNRVLFMTARSDCFLISLSMQRKFNLILHPPKYLESKRVKQSCINRKNLGVNLYPVNFLRSPFSYLSNFLLLSKAELMVKYWASTQLRPPDILLHIWMNQWPPVFPPIVYQHLSKTDLGCIHDQNTRELGHLGNIWVDAGRRF